jgi:hypothetical protein
MLLNLRDLAALCTSAEALCADLEREIDPCNAGAINGADLKCTFASTYQTRTVSIMRSLMYHPPAQWGFTNMFPPGGRIFGSQLYDLAVAGLDENKAATELMEIVNELRDLVRRQPTR